jgi:hypothetical protein
VKLGAGLTVSATVVVALRVPEVPLIVTVAVPVVAVPLAVSVSTLLPVVGFVPNAAVRPLGNPEAASVTLPLNPFCPVTVMVDVAELPRTTVSEVGEAAIVKLGAGLTVTATVVVALRLPEVPLMVTVAVPVVAVLLAVSVSTLLPVVGFVPNAAVTPLGIPEATSVTLPLNPFCPATVMVDVAELP